MSSSKKTLKRKNKSSTLNPTKQRRTNGSSGSQSDDSPVFVQRIEYDKKGKRLVPSVPLNPDLDTLLYPMKAGSFLEKYLRQQAVHITCEDGFGEIHAKTRVASLCQEMYNLNVESILRNTSSDNIFLWLRQRHDDKNGKSKEGHTNGKKDDLIQSIEISEVETAIALHKIAGHATYCRAPPKVEQSLVSSLLRATGLGCGQYDPSGDSAVTLARGEVETFVSTPGHVTNWHFDFQENFTIQLSGIKRWTIQQGTIRDPIRGCTPHYAAPEAVESQLKAAHLFDRKFRFGHPETGVNAIGKVVTIDIKPGDVFYFPAGMWHKIETIEPGVSINVSLMANNYASIVGQAIQHYLMKFPQWRQPVLNNSAHQVIPQLNSLLQSLPGQLQLMLNAESIIPPILQNPPTFSLGDEEEDQDIDDTDGDDSGDDGSNDNGVNEDDDAENDDLLIEDQEVIDPREYNSYPANWDIGLNVDTAVTFRHNPLAVLHRMDEIKHFYQGDAAQQEVSNDGVFVLNVNFAGNEMHQSSVRVVFCDSENGFVQRLHEVIECNVTADTDNLLPHREIRLALSAEDLAHAKFLIYHGYMTALP